MQVVYLKRKPNNLDDRDDVYECCGLYMKCIGDQTWEEIKCPRCKDSFAIGERIGY